MWKERVSNTMTDETVFFPWQVQLTIISFGRNQKQFGHKNNLNKAFHLRFHVSLLCSQLQEY